MANKSFQHENRLLGSLSRESTILQGGKWHWRCH